MRKPLALALFGLLLLASSAGATTAIEIGPTQQELLDVNTASSEQLQTVPGIGPALAQRIIDWREQHGPFERIEDLLNVRGIGEKTLDSLRQYLEVRTPDEGAEG